MKFLVIIKTGIDWIASGIGTVRNYLSLIDWIMEVLRYASETFPLDHEGRPTIKLETKDKNK